MQSDNSLVTDTQNKKIYIGMVLVIILILSLGYYIYRDITSLDIGKNSDNNGDRITYTNNDGVTIEQVPLEGDLPDFPVPDLNTKLDFGDETNQEFISIMTDKIDEVRELLKEDPNRFDLWLDLAINYKIIEDYTKAEEAWIFATKMIPDNPIAYGNLANLYGYNLKDNAKADEYYSKAIEYSGSLTYLYFQSAEYYEKVRGDIPKAISIVELGLERSPEDNDLKELLSYLKSK